MPEDKFRIEKDPVVGQVRVPEEVLFGAQTQTAKENFIDSDLQLGPDFLYGLSVVKIAAATINVAFGLLDEQKGKAIRKAATEVMEGNHDQDFPISIFQLGSGTNTNMNANEVIANRATEILGGDRGSGIVHPNDDVNKGQSSNDVFPTAIHISAMTLIKEQLLPSLEHLSQTLSTKSSEFDDVVKTGRTHLQDATPVRLGQEFSGFASQVQHGIDRIQNSCDSLLELPIGGTAVGTGLNTHPDFPKLMVESISDITEINFREADNHFEAQAARDAIVEISGALKTVATSLMKIANDLRWMSSGPQTGFREITLPTVPPSSSSIMPGKTNPIIPEATCQAMAQVIGNDTTITLGGQSGNFELNVMKPVMAYNLLQSIKLVASTSRNLATKCVAGITANKETCEKYAKQSPSLITAIAPDVGYDRATELARMARKQDKTIPEVLLEQRVYDKEEIEKIIDIVEMTERGYI